MSRLRRLAKRVLPPGSRRHSFIKRHIEARLYPSGTPRPVDLSYEQWTRAIEPHTWTPYVTSDYQPLISVIIPAWNTPDRYLADVVDSVIDQTYDNWELVLVQGGSRPERAEAIRRQAARDQRINLVEAEANGGIAANTNLGIKVASGEFIAFLDHDDVLAPQALNEVAAALQRDRQIDLIYSDFDYLSDDGTKRQTPFFWPDWSPDLLRCVNYMTHLCIVRTKLARSLGGIRSDFDAAQDYDFILRVTEQTQRIHHIPHILYHWRLAAGSTAIRVTDKATTEKAGKAALTEHFARLSVAAQVTEIPGSPSNYHIKYALPSKTKVSIIIPFKDKVELLQTLIPSIYKHTKNPDFELVLVSNNSIEPTTHTYIKQLAKDHKNVKIVIHDEPFNYSGVNNVGRRHADGNVLLFLNNDMEVLGDDWLRELASVALQPGVGAVGAWLTYPDGTTQHAGVVVGMLGAAGHIFRRRQGVQLTYTGFTHWPRNYLAVTGACIAIVAERFDQVGGFNENFQTAGSDVTLGIDLYETGYRNVFWPFARLVHYENVSVGPYGQRDDNKHDFEESMKHYNPYMNGRDPYYNPNLDLMDEWVRLRSSL